MNGLALRDEKETRALINAIKQAGVHLIDLTFYGVPDFHDAFAGRKGDFDFLLRILKAAQKALLPVQIGIALYKSNLTQMDPLLAQLSAYSPQSIRIFLPHTKGRGWSLRNDRITQTDFDFLSPAAKAHFSAVPHHTEQAWLEMNQWEEPQRRLLTLCPTPENIAQLERMSLSQMLSFPEEKDDQFLTRMPSLPELARRYGNPENQQLFRMRDLHLLCQQMYLRDHPDICDVHD